MKVSNRSLTIVVLVLACSTYAAFEFGRSTSEGTAALGPMVDAGPRSDTPRGPTNHASVARQGKGAVLPAAGSSGMEAEVAALRKELEELSATVREAGQRSREASLGAPFLEENVPARPVMDERALAAEAQKRFEEMEAVESGFHQEVVDEAWSSYTASQLAEAMESLAISPTDVRDLECRAASCRVEIAGHNPVHPVDLDELDIQGSDTPAPLSLEKSLPVLALQLAGSLPNMVAYEVDDANGGRNTVLYFSRDSDLPPQSER